VSGFGKDAPFVGLFHAREHEVNTGRRKLKLQQSVEPFPSAYERAEAMGRFAERAMLWFAEAGIDWKTVTFEVDIEPLQPFDQVWRWSGWSVD
jgi:hypothetical protein